VLGEEELMTTLLLAIDVARRVGLSVERVRQLASSNALPVMAGTPGGVRLFDPAAVERDAVERERARQRTADALLRRARAGRWRPPTAP